MTNSRRSKLALLLSGFAAAALSGCFFETGPRDPAPTPSPTPSPTATAPAPTTIAFDFANGAEGFTAQIADFQDGFEPIMEFESGLQEAPDVAEPGFFLKSMNRSDDAFMYLFARIDNLKPNQNYRVEATVRFATNIPPGCSGIGGSPGDSVYIQVGAAESEPMRVVVEGVVRPDFDHGNQSQDGEEGVVIGTFAQTEETGTTCSDDPYSVKELSTGDKELVVTADAEGRLWPFVGTDSAFEGLTRIYWLDGSFTLTETD